jgi:hypothetical protein
VPESIATGFGPECSAKMGIPRAELPVEPVLPVKEPPLLIRVTYSSIDGGGCKTMKFKTLKGAQSFAQKWVGVGPELGYGYAVSGDGVGKITCEGVPVAALFPLLQGV